MTAPQTRLLRNAEREGVTGTNAQVALTLGQRPTPVPQLLQIRAAARLAHGPLPLADGWGRQRAIGLGTQATAGVSCKTAVVHGVGARAGQYRASHAMPRRG